MIQINNNIWIRHGRITNEGKINLLCFPYAGGSPGIFAGWGNLLDSGINLCPVLYPGRDIRLMEPVPANIHEMVRQFADENPDIFQRPYALAGYCVGGLFAYETAIYAKEKYGNPPTDFFAISFASPDFPMTSAEICPNLSKEGIIAYLLSNHIIDPEYARDDAFLDYYLPIIKGDLEAVDRYQYHNTCQMSGDIMAFYGKEDLLFGTSEKELLRKYTNDTYQYLDVPGGHYCLTENQEQIVQLINETLKKKLKEN